MMRTRRGFSLPLVLWVISAGAALAFAATLSTRAGIGAARYRADHYVDRWLVEGCGELLHAELDTWMRASADSSLAVAATRWRRLPSAPALDPSPCAATISFIAVGAAVDVSTASASALRAVMRSAVDDDQRADSLVDALLDWQDADHIPRPFGAEATEYRRAGRVGPRNGPVADIDELRAIRGFDELDADDWSALRAVVATEAAPLPISATAPVLLGLLPGMPVDAALRVEQARRRRPSAVETLDQLMAVLGSAAEDSLRARYGELRSATVDEPIAWLVRVEGTEAALELRLVRARAGVAVLQRRELR